MSCANTVYQPPLQRDEQKAAEAARGDPRDRFTGYEPVDSEGNPWWEPPDRDFFEGGAWEVRRCSMGHLSYLRLKLGLSLCSVAASWACTFSLAGAA